MEQNLHIHRILQERNKNYNWAYMSSIIVKNNNIPLFEEYYGMLDYDWLLKITKDRKCVETKTETIRHVDGNNLSLKKDYRIKDFYMALIIVDNNKQTIKSMFSTRARYHYIMNECKEARFFFIRGIINWKTILYYISTYNNTLRKWIIKKFKVFG